MMDTARGNMTFVIAMSNEKGGVAKTTSTLSLGAALAELNHRVLLIDLDPQANLSLALGLETAEVELTSASVLIDNASYLSGNVCHQSFPLCTPGCLFEQTRVFSG